MHNGEDGREKLGTNAPQCQAGGECGLSEMLEGGRPGCVFTLSGAVWGAEAALLQVMGFFGIYKGYVGARIQLFLDPFLQPSDLAESQRATCDRWVLERLINSTGMSCSWGSRASKPLFLHITWMLHFSSAVLSSPRLPPTFPSLLMKLGAVSLQQESPALQGGQIFSSLWKRAQQEPGDCSPAPRIL